MSQSAFLAPSKPVGRVGPVLMLLICGACAPSAWSEQLDARAPSAKPVPGFRSVDIGGRRLRYLCGGRGSPTVLIEPAGGTSLETVFSWGLHSGWPVIFPEIQKVTRVCVYDRAGLGRSDRVSGPRTSLDVARDLHAMLVQAKIHPPCVLAGQSFGGMNARMFASEYPDSVAGMILIDSSHPDQYQRFAEVLPARRPDESLVLRGLRDGPDLSGTREWIDFEGNAQLVRKTKGIGDKPLIVLTRSPGWRDDFVPVEWEALVNPIWQELQTGLCDLSTDCKHIIAANAGHNIQRDEPQLVIDAILEVVGRVRGPDAAANPTK